jgi:deoxyribodipyrimidine photo-lyase
VNTAIVWFRRDLGITDNTALEASERESTEMFISELVWREFYFSILWHFPEVLDVEFNPKFRGMKWPGSASIFEDWRAGETGFPIVDAARRQLAQTGYMPNRARMIVAMFLTQGLQMDWRLGESYFMQKLTDGEIASNNGGWQWSAGTGADAAPYFRILNPWIQSARFDPDGEYVKKWVPELRGVPARRFFEPLLRASVWQRAIRRRSSITRERDKALELFGRYSRGDASRV